MNDSCIQHLCEADIHAYGSDQLRRFEKQLTRYFAREYKRFTGNQEAVDVASGPIALAAEKLADQHYDEGIDFFRTFLDHETMSYTMAYFDADPQAALASKKTLAEAQTDKFNLIASRLELTGKERLLNIGCGFGYFESYLLQRYPELQITSTTHSKDQYDFIQNRRKDNTDALATNRFRLFYGEINDHTLGKLGEGAYDIAISVGLMEQINNIAAFYALLSRLLTEGGRMFHHLIVSRDLIPQFLDPEKTLIGDYFPGGKVLPFYALKHTRFESFERQGAWFINGMNYWQTLDKWHENFWRNLASIYPDQMTAQRVDYWNRYFVLCKALFYPDNGHAYGNGQYLYRKCG